MPEQLEVDRKMLEKTGLANLNRILSRDEARLAQVESERTRIHYRMDNVRFELNRRSEAANVSPSSV